MQKYSEKEYDYLKKDISEAKKSITTYIGLAISVTGATTILTKFFFSSEESSKIEFYNLAPLFILSSMIVITFIFEIIWYKFVSHNRIVGYIRLMNQEVAALSPTGKFKVVELHRNVLAWDFIMARYSNVVYNKGYKEIEESVRKINFSFDLALTRDLSKLYYYKDGRKEKVYNDGTNSYRKYTISELQEEFFKICIYPQYHDERKWFKQIQAVFKNTFLHLLIYLWKRPVRRSVRSKIDKNYFSLSWAYPKKILQIAVLLFFGLILLFFYVFRSTSTLIFFPHYKEWDFGLLLSFDMFLLLILFILIVRWTFSYVYRVQDLISGRYSIDHFCWIFFIYRVQVLNKLKIRPVYFSRGFRRFVKTKFLLQYIYDNKESLSSIFKNTKALEDYIQRLERALDFKGEFSKEHTIIKCLANKKYIVDPKYRKTLPQDCLPISEK